MKKKREMCQYYKKESEKCHILLYVEVVEKQ